MSWTHIELRLGGPGGVPGPLGFERPGGWAAQPRARASHLVELGEVFCSAVPVGEGVQGGGLELGRGLGLRKAPVMGNGCSWLGRQLGAALLAGISAELGCCWAQSQQGWGRGAQSELSPPRVGGKPSGAGFRNWEAGAATQYF